MQLANLIRILNGDFNPPFSERQAFLTGFNMNSKSADPAPVSASLPGSDDDVERATLHRGQDDGSGQTERLKTAEPLGTGRGVRTPAAAVQPLLLNTNDFLDAAQKVIEDGGADDTAMP
ncbi:MAG: hypothetical protein V4731_08190 [Pseudomonadota bacterium]